MQNASADITRPPSHCEARRCHHRRPPAEGLRSPDPRADCDGCNRTAQRHPSPDQPRAGPSLRQDSQTTLIRSATTRPITSEVLPAADGTKPKNLGALQIAMRISPSRNVSRGIQAPAIRRCGELLRHIEPASAVNLKQNRRDGTVPSVTRLSRRRMRAVDERSDTDRA